MESGTQPGQYESTSRIGRVGTKRLVGLRLRINENNEIKMTTTQPSNEASASTTAETFFPHIVDSEGWSTQFVLFSGTAGQTSSGALSFVGQDGQILDLDLQE